MPKLILFPIESKRNSDSNMDTGMVQQEKWNHVSKLLKKVFLKTSPELSFTPMCRSLGIPPWKRPTFVGRGDAEEL